MSIHPLSGLTKSCYYLALMWPPCTWVCSGEDGGTRLDSQPMFCMGRLYRLRQLSTYPGQRHQASTNCNEVSVHHWGMGHEWVHCNHLTILILLGKTTRQLYLEGRPLKLTDLPTHTRRVLHAATVGRIILLMYGNVTFMREGRWCRLLSTYCQSAR